MSFLISIYTKIKLKLYLGVLNKFFDQKKLLYKFRSRIYNKTLLELIEKNNEFSKYFFIENFHHGFDLMKTINEYPKTDNKYKNKNIKTYQSEHNIHKHDAFKNFSDYLENFLNKIIIPEYGLNTYRIKIDKMWFVISYQNGKINPHNHLDGHISGVLYPKSFISDDNGLMIYNPFKSLSKITFNYLDKINTKFINSSHNLEISDVNNMIIFDSFLMHSVNKVKFQSDKDCRVSLAWDAIFVKE